MTPHTRLPLLWFHAQVDLRDLAGAAIFKRGAGADVELPDFDVDADEGIYEHAIALANGNGSTSDDADPANRRDLVSDFQDQHPDGYGEGGLRITAGDRVQIWCTAAFDLVAGADNTAFGLPAAGASSVLDLSSGEHRVTASDPWVRGVVEDKHLTISPDVGDDFDVPRYAYHVQSLITLFRRRGRTLDDGGADYVAGQYDGDDNNPSDCLEALDNATYDATLRRIRHYLDAEGHYCIAWPTSLSLSAYTWLSTTMRDRLGFTGNLAGDSEVPEDTVSAVGNVTVYRAARVMPGVLHTSRPWIRRPKRLGGERTDAERLLGGGAASAPVDQWEDLLFDFWLDGPESPHTEDDLGAHWSRQVLRYAQLGAPLTVFVGQDPRRHLEIDQVAEEQPAFSDLYSADPCGGRWYGWVRSPEDDAEVAIEYDEDEQGGQFWAQASVRISPPRGE